MNSFMFAKSDCNIEIEKKRREERKKNKLHNIMEIK